MVEYGSIATGGDRTARVGNAGDIAQIGTVIQRVREVIGGVIAIAAALREGFDAWAVAGNSTS